MAQRYKQDWKTNELVHRQVVEKSIGRKLHKDEIVHHKNGDTFDNRLENLEVMSQLEHNRLHKQKYPRIKNCVICGKEYEPYESKRKTAKVCSKECKVALDKLNAAKRKRSIEQISTSGEHIKTWDSARDIQNATGFHESNINKCCKGKIRTYKGYVWKYAM